MGIVLAMVWDPFIGSFLNRERNRNEVRSLHASVNVGMTSAEVDRELKSGRYPHLHLYEASGNWVATAPEEFGAGNWIVLITVVKGQVAKVMIRTSDSALERPAEAPPDKGARGRLKWDGPSNNGLQLTKAARCAPFAFRHGGSR